MVREGGFSSPRDTVIWTPQAGTSSLGWKFEDGAVTWHEKVKSPEETGRRVFLAQGTVYATKMIHIHIDTYRYTDLVKLRKDHSQRHSWGAPGISEDGLRSPHYFSHPSDGPLEKERAASLGEAPASESSH